MDIKEVWSEYRDYTQEASKYGRALGAAAAAIAWMFRHGNGEFPVLILLSLIGTSVFFALDLLQYVSAAVMLRLWLRSQEHRMFKAKGSIDGDVTKPPWLDVPASALFSLKLAALVGAYANLVPYITMQALGM